MTQEEAKEVIQLVFGDWPEGSKTAEALATIYAREDALEAENARLRGTLEIAAVYLDDLGDNLLRDDADMMLENCRDPKAVAADIRTALGDTQ